VVPRAALEDVEKMEIFSVLARSLTSVLRCCWWTTRSPAGGHTAFKPTAAVPHSLAFRTLTNDVIALSEPEVGLFQIHGFRSL
jgi:hypothetical protein